MIQDRINAIRRDLEGVKRTRELHRRGRRRVPYPVVALVGYTNAGKSTLFNRLTGDGVLARDQLFATLDPTMREVVLESGRRVIVSDTVGFISDLPTGLIAAFRATLEEVVEADLIVHVRNIAHPDSDAQARDVESVLGELGVVTGAGGTAVIEVWNKSDLLDAERRQVLAHTAGRRDDPPRLVSAVTGEGVGDLLAGIDEALAGQDTWMRLAIEPAGGALLSWLHENAQVLERDTDTEGVTHVDIRIDAAHRDRLLGRLSRGDAAGHARVEEAGG